MGLFSKKKEESVNLPRLPEVPSLPMQFPTHEEMDFEKEEKHELPTFPSNSFADRFSQSTIKNAVEGDDEPEMPPLPKTPIPKPQIKRQEPKEIKIPEPPKTTITQSFEMKDDEEKHEEKRKEPVFIRVDKFEEALKVFDKTKDRISEIEVLLKETKELKQKEEEELSLWEKEIQEVKTQIEKVDKDIFSKI